MAVIIFLFLVIYETAVYNKNEIVADKWRGEGWKKILA